MYLFMSSVTVHVNMATAALYTGIIKINCISRTMFMHVSDTFQRGRDLPKYDVCVCVLSGTNNKKRALNYNDLQ